MIGYADNSNTMPPEAPSLEQVQAMMQGIPLGDGPISGVAKGWRVRKVTGYSTIGGHKDWSGFHNLIARAQKAKIAADKAKA